MKRIIDLTHPIREGMPVFPGDTEYTTELIHSIGGTGFNVSKFTMGTHNGTHVDVPHHVIPSDKAVENILLDTLIGWATVLDLGDLSPNFDITSADLDVFADKVTESSRILLRTNWGKRVGDPNFYSEYPSLSEGAALWLNARKVKLLGIEQPSVEKVNSNKIHRALLETNMVVLESLANLDKITQDRVYLVALPIKLAGADGAPTRVIAIEGMDIPE